MLWDLLQKEYYSSVHLYADSKYVLEIKKFIIFMLFFGVGGSPHSTYICTQDRLVNVTAAIQAPHAVNP